MAEVAINNNIIVFLNQSLRLVQVDGNVSVCFQSTHAPGGLASQDVWSQCVSFNQLNVKLIIGKSFYGNYQE